MRLEEDKKGEKKEEEKECGGRPWFQVAALALATTSPRPATATLYHHLSHISNPLYSTLYIVLHCTSCDNKQIHSVLSIVARFAICCSSNCLLGGTQVLVRGMNSHISSAAPLTSTKPRAKPPLDLGQISIKASREIGKILGHASSLSWNSDSFHIWATHGKSRGKTLQRCKHC